MHHRVHPDHTSARKGRDGINVSIAMGGPFAGTKNPAGPETSGVILWR